MLTKKSPVPVVAIITKFDGLITKFFSAERDKGASIPAARLRAKVLAEEDFKDRIVPQLMAIKNPPAQCVYANGKPTKN